MKGHRYLLVWELRLDRSQITGCSSLKKRSIDVKEEFHVKYEKTNLKGRDSVDDLRCPFLLELCRFDCSADGKWGVGVCAIAVDERACSISRLSSISHLKTCIFNLKQRRGLGFYIHSNNIITKNAYLQRLTAIQQRRAELLLVRNKMDMIAL